MLPESQIVLAPSSPSGRIGQGPLRLNNGYVLVRLCGNVDVYDTIASALVHHEMRVSVLKTLADASHGTSGEAPALGDPLSLQPYAQALTSSGRMHASLHV